MPELPDVEGFRRYFNRFAAGKTVERAEVLDAAMLRKTSPQGLGRALRGRRLEEAQRHGKWLIAPAGGPTLLLHFGMTGLVAWSAHEEPPHRHDRLTLHLSGGRLVYRNMRRFGAISLAPVGADPQSVIGPLGPDAQSISRERFREVVERRRGGIKALLMDQKALAGVGNVLSDEVLWRARIHPQQTTSGLSKQATGRLYEELHETIRAANRRGRIPPDPDWLTGVRDRRGDCPRCGARVAKATVAGRTACWCPRCQRRRRR